MLTQTAIRSDAFHRPGPPTRNISPAVAKVFDSASERKPLGQSIFLMGSTKSYPHNTEIYGEDEPAEYLYKVISGAVRTYRRIYEDDGRRQIGGFYLPGDIFGLEFADEHTLSAEAIADANVLVIKRPCSPRSLPIMPELPRSFLRLLGTRRSVCRSASCCSSRPRRSASQASSWKWRSACRSVTPSSFLCRARTLPIISA